MIVPAVMGCPLWVGVKPRVAKKYLAPLWRSHLCASMAQTGVGDLVRDCSGFNVRVSKVEPVYRRAGSGTVLHDIEITNENGGLCSFLHCGVEAAVSREATIAYWEQMVAYWTSVGDPWRFAQRYEFTTVDADGVATVDYIAMENKYGHG